MYYSYVFKELRHRNNRTLVNILGISVGIALFISINALSSAYKKAAEQPFKDMGADLVVQRAQKQQSNSGSQPKSMRGIRLPFSNQLFSPQDLTILKNLENINASAQALLLWEFTKTGFSSILGVDLQQPALGGLKAKDWIYKGRFPEKKGEIALEKHFAKFKKIKLGSSFIISGQAFDVVGTIEIKEGAQVSASNIYMLIDNARDLLGKNTDAVNLIYLGLKDPSIQNRIKSQISSKIKGASINSSDSFLELMGGVSMISDKFSLIASMVGLIGAVLLIIKTMISNLVERVKDIGILKALGWTRTDIQKQLMVETFIQTIMGGLLGIMMGYLISFLLGFLSISIPIPGEMGFVPSMANHTQDLNQIVRLPISVSLSLAATAMSLSVIIGCITGYILGKRTEQMKPADIFRQL
ncbi:MAG: FtsX-like permease family protein [Desulfobacula sp.]|jgi:putative ABC transport system permease protein|uniref:ABC transporter permease n=1 Tax=Desulfobacula sp. TaxID=2593537 RepID=UPI001D660BEF|nr:FtsX-like permease family protein [Desulfobacula sp.]MBT3805199.1 FtsX-like permease family protein [Desulfobacula sp.]MBT4875203.1 FtsX-like permease family protein [Desulfobacula sp.]MBT6749606.1 FtsX-like permease family protein [Desulfobacula sp.]MBT7051985.1 FtsX-like permease family protein [Desulfobacula sp.]